MGSLSVLFLFCSVQFIKTTGMSGRNHSTQEEHTQSVPFLVVAGRADGLTSVFDLHLHLHLNPCHEPKHSFPLFNKQATIIMTRGSPSNPPPPPKWVIDLNSPPRPKAKNTNIANPPGYTEASSGKVQPFCSHSTPLLPVTNGIRSVMSPHPKRRPANPQPPPKPTRSS